MLIFVCLICPYLCPFLRADCPIYAVAPERYHAEGAADRGTGLACPYITGSVPAQQWDAGRQAASLQRMEAEAAAKHSAIELALLAKLKTNVNAARCEGPHLWEGLAFAEEIIDSYIESAKDRA